MSKDRPIWILSAYGPGKDPPLQLFGGFLREQSFEELRLRHYELASTGNEQQAIQEAQELVNNAEQQTQVALRDVEGAIKYIINGENEHPNRIDICKAQGANPSYSQGADHNSQPKIAFGQPSAFGKPAFPTPPHNTSNFSRPSTSFGQPSIPGLSFGNPSSLGQQAPPPASIFGQPSTLENPSSFNRPKNLFGQSNSTIASGAQAPTSISTFGQSSNPSPFAAVQAGPSLLGGTSAPGASQPASSAFSQSNPFQSSAFGQPSVPAATSGFSQPSSSVSNAFGRPTAPASTNAFGQPTMAKTNPFTQAGNVQTSTSFGQAPTALMSSGQTNEATISPALGRTTSAQASTTQHNTTQRDSQGKLITWNGKAVSYINDEPCFKGNNDNWEKIWFPDGPPVFNKAVELPDEDYDQATKESYKFLGTQGVFKDGIIPSLPPRREWCSWDF